ncbi:SGNH/GDSL hydrolase family protein [Methyloversatilis sp.]|uniref:SGNH/GDSL hydrolase family protein n=1 Tax=Methyloversatilis sp. TaxID=2569862 RepID=UPI0035B39C75
MTVRLLAALGQYPANAIVTFAAAVETSLVAEKLASTDLTGGVVYQAPVDAGRAGEAARWVTDADGNPVDLLLPGTAGRGGASSLVGAGGGKGQASGRSTIIIGDSLGEQNGGPGVATGYERLWANHGYATWLNVLLRGGLSIARNYAVGGQTSAELLTRLRSGEILLDGVDYVLWLLSGNDIAYGAVTTAAAQRTLIDQIVPLLTRSGATVLAGTIPPRAHTGTGTFDTSTKRDLVMQSNDYLLQIGRAQSGIIAFDTFGPLSEFDGTPRAGLLRDSPAIHPSAQCALELAQLIESAGSGVLPRDGYQLARAGLKGQMLTSALSSWTANTPIGSFGTETVTNAVTGSDGRADWTRVQLASPSAAGACRQLSHSAITPGASTFAEGDVVVAVAEVEISSCADMRAINFQLNVTGPGVTVDSMGEFAQSVSNGGFTVLSAAPLNRKMIATPEYTVPAGVTSITPRIRLMANSTSSAGDIRLRNPSFINLTKLRA